MRYKRMKELPRLERPREKLARYGPQRLSDRELISLLLDTGIRRKGVMSLAKQVEDVLRKKGKSTTLSDLTAIPGLGLAKASRIIAGVELAERLRRRKELEISSPEIVWHISTEIARSKKEAFLVLYLDARNREVHRQLVSRGTVDSAFLHPREVFETALKVGAVSLILVHNHPSGYLEPSEEDVSITKRIMDGGNLLGIEVLDHLIVSKDGYYSMREGGYL